MHLFAAAHIDNAFFSNKKGQYARFTYWWYAEIIKAVNVNLDYIDVHFGNTIYRQVLDIHMGINCALLIAYSIL